MEEKTAEGNLSTMKCLNCGRESAHYLCAACTTPEILDKVFGEIRFFKPETCQNPYLEELAAGLTEPYAERDVIPKILELFAPEISEFYTCLYYWMRRDSRFEQAAVSYLDTHPFEDRRTQEVLERLLNSYLPNDFAKPQCWCEQILKHESLCEELYLTAAKYFSLIAEYDKADALTARGLQLLENGKGALLLWSSPDDLRNRLQKQAEDTVRYRTKKPYCPRGEERQRALAPFYDKRGIPYPWLKTATGTSTGKGKHVKVAEGEFVIHERYDAPDGDYCAFWCAEAFSLAASKPICQIAAVRVRNGKEADIFESLVYPWDGTSARQNAAKALGISLEEIENAPRVAQVMPEFFAFAGKDVLVSSDAAGMQARLLSRAARYAGMREIGNELFDLLDFAADLPEKPNMECGSRAKLLDFFAIPEGKTALEKARNNRLLFDALRNCKK